MNIYDFAGLVVYFVIQLRWKILRASGRFILEEEVCKKNSFLNTDIYDTLALPYALCPPGIERMDAGTVFAMPNAGKS